METETDRDRKRKHVALGVSHPVVDPAVTL